LGTVLISLKKIPYKIVSFALEKVGLSPFAKLGILLLGGIMIVNIAPHNLNCRYV